ncbi:hypothetical protein [Pseudorhodoferax sp. Leaf274]|uniref:hypothetical protein n=1 Tax=Pseudorhodoferax sp. Leaf274 TaxID=1736318 RepID=UPI000702D664|nr:hypothetical protein [Pseudorhodoferax sp. Leaf274]KQP45599.1 hypothetical protein ASF44_25960 [Pseudorhodoferax sp. Leaf274]
MPDSYFSLQLAFALRHAVQAQVPFEVAVARCTNLRRRLNLGGPSCVSRWGEFLAEMRRLQSDPSALLATCVAFHDARPPAVPARSFGCFAYEPPNAAGVLRMHFMPPAGASSSPLAAVNMAARRAELGEMFSHVLRNEKGVRSVLGVSWLYNLDAYKRLFPSAYVASVKKPWFPLHLNGSSTWGQVLDWRGQVKPEMRAALLSRLHLMDAEAPWIVFPLQAMAATCGVQAFHELLS